MWRRLGPPPEPPVKVAVPRWVVKRRVGLGPAPRSPPPPASSVTTTRTMLFQPAGRALGGALAARGGWGGQGGELIGGRPVRLRPGAGSLVTTMTILSVPSVNLVQLVKTVRRGGLAGPRGGGVSTRLAVGGGCLETTTTTCWWSNRIPWSNQPPAGCRRRRRPRAHLFMVLQPPLVKRMGKRGVKLVVKRGRGEARRDVPPLRMSQRRPLVVKVLLVRLVVKLRADRRKVRAHAPAGQTASQTAGVALRSFQVASVTLSDSSHLRRAHTHTHSLTHTHTYTTLTDTHMQTHKNTTQHHTHIHTRAW